MADLPTVRATNITTIFRPAGTSETLTYDDAGNLSSDARWTYTWDAYNRLTGMESKPGDPAASRRKLAFTYDAHGRRIRRDISTWTNGSYQVVDSRKFVYDGWHLVGELNAANNAVIRSYAWAGDRLMALRQGSTIYIPVLDANGNVMALVNQDTRAVDARYEYGPYGLLLKAAGPMALQNPIRYSSQYQDDATGLIYYGYRYLNPATQRWISRDPIGMRGGFNLYGFLSNNPINQRDYLGLATLAEILAEPPPNVGPLLSQTGMDVPLDYDDSPSRATAKELAEDVNALNALLDQWIDDHLLPSPLLMLVPKTLFRAGTFPLQVAAVPGNVCTSYDHAQNEATTRLQIAGDGGRMFLEIWGAIPVAGGGTKVLLKEALKVENKAAVKALLQAEEKRLLADATGVGFGSAAVTASQANEILQMQKELSQLVNTQAGVVERWLRSSDNLWAQLYRSVKESNPNFAAGIRGRILDIRMRPQIRELCGDVPGIKINQVIPGAGNALRPDLYFPNLGGRRVIFDIGSKTKVNSIDKYSDMANDVIALVPEQWVP